MMGGNAEQITQVTSILECYTASRLHMGDAGTGQVAKLCNQIAQVVTIQGIGEAMSFAETQGADKQKVFDVMSSGFAASRMLELLGPKMVTDDFTPLMKSKLLDKDIDIALTSSQGAGLDLPALKLVRDAIAVLQKRAGMMMIFRHFSDLSENKFFKLSGLMSSKPEPYCNRTNT